MSCMWILRRSSAALLFLSCLLLVSQAAPASAATLTVLAPASATPGVQALAAPFTTKTGTAVTVAGGAREKIFATLKAGGPADVVLLPSSDFADTPTIIGMTPLGRIVVGVGVR